MVSKPPSSNILGNAWGVTTMSWSGGKTALDLGVNPSINQPVQDPQMTDGPGYRTELPDRWSQSAGIVLERIRDRVFLPLFFFVVLSQCHQQGLGLQELNMLCGRITHIMWVKPWELWLWIFRTKLQTLCSKTVLELPMESLPVSNKNYWNTPTKCQVLKTLHIHGIFLVTLQQFKIAENPTMSFFLNFPH